MIVNESVSMCLMMMVLMIKMMMVMCLQIGREDFLRKYVRLYVHNSNAYQYQRLSDLEG